MWAESKAARHVAPGHSASIYTCGGFGPMVGGPAGSAGAVPQIILQVGQQVRLTESGDWGGYHVSAPVSDEPSVLRLVEGAAGKVVGVFVAVALATRTSARALTPAATVYARSPRSRSPAPRRERRHDPQGRQVVDAWVSVRSVGC